MPSPERFSSNPLAFRRFCCECGTWRQNNDFAVRQWADKEKTQVKYFSSECRACHRLKSKERWQNVTDRERQAARTRWRVHYRRQRRQARVPEIGPRVFVEPRRGDVPRHILARWIRKRLESGEYSTENPERHGGQYDGISQFAYACGVDPRFIRTLLDGYYIRSYKNKKSKKTKIVKRVPYDWVSYDTVDRMVQNEGSTTLDDLFPLLDYGEEVA